MELDKKFLLCYTELDENIIRNAHHAWFLTEKELFQFFERRDPGRKAEMELAVEIISYRILG